MFIVAGILWPATALHNPISGNVGPLLKNMITFAALLQPFYGFRPN